MTLPLFDVRTPLERLTIFTPLGIRFWDAAWSTQVSEGLTVTARPQGTRQAVAYAFRTASGVYAFQGLPGLRAVEYPPQDTDPFGSPPATRCFVVEVTDQERRFLPMVLSVELPYRGIFPTGTLGSPLGHRLPGVYLFSSPTRPAVPSLAVVRAQLVDAVTHQPAAHALMTVRASGQAVAYGLADERGGIAVLFPYPAFTAMVGGSPPGTPLATGGLQHWEVSIGVRYEPAVLTIPPGATLPDLRSTVSQAPGVIWATVASQPSSLLSAELIFGQELVLRTDETSVLLIGAAASPP